MDTETIKNGTRAWSSETRELITLPAGTKIVVQDVGSRYRGEFLSVFNGSLALGTLEDGTQIEVMRSYCR